MQTKTSYVTQCRLSFSERQTQSHLNRNLTKRFSDKITYLNCSILNCQRLYQTTIRPVKFSINRTRKWSTTVPTATLDTLIPSDHQPFKISLEHKAISWQNCIKTFQIKRPRSIRYCEVVRHRLSGRKSFLFSENRVYNGLR